MKMSSQTEVAVFPEKQHLCLHLSPEIPGRSQTPSMGGQGGLLQACLLLLLLLLLLLPAAASDTVRDYYETLNVEPTASGTQIKRAFRTLAVKYHPDKNKSAGAEKAFRKIAEAYKVLSNSERRRQYDQEGRGAFLRNQADDDFEEEHHSHFHFSFTDFSSFQDEDDYHDLSEKESHFYWSFEPEGGDHYEHGFTGFHSDFPFDDTEEDYYYY